MAPVMLREDPEGVDAIAGLAGMLSSPSRPIQDPRLVAAPSDAGIPSRSVLTDGEFETLLLENYRDFLKVLDCLAKSVRETCLRRARRSMRSEGLAPDFSPGVVVACDLDGL